MLFLSKIFSEREKLESFSLNDPVSVSDCRASVVDKLSTERSNGGIILVGKNSKFLGGGGQNLFRRLSVRLKSTWRGPTQRTRTSSLRNSEQTAGNVAQPVSLQGADFFLRIQYNLSLLRKVWLFMKPEKS